MDGLREYLEINTESDIEITQDTCLLVYEEINDDTDKQKKS